jgi:hypothetical protein
MIAKLKPHALPLVLVFVAIIIAYFGIHLTFYQQDEWQEIGLLRSGVVSINPFAHFSIWQILAGQGRTFSDLLLSFFLMAFPYHMEPYAIVTLLLHALNASLLYFLTYRLSQSRIAAFIASLVFATNAVANQTIVWMAAVATLPATALIFLSIHSYLNFLESKKMSWLYWSLAAIFVSLLFKEIGIFLVIFLPLLHLIWFKKPLQTLKTNWPIFAYGAVAIIARIIQLSSSTAANGTISAGGHDFLAKIIVHLVLYPLTSIFQTLIPSQISYALADKISYLQYAFVTTTPLAEIVPQTILTDLISVTGSVAVVAIVILFNKPKDQANSRFIWIAILLATLSFLPYAILDRGGSYMDSRYYYLAAAGLGMLLGFIADRLWRLRLTGQVIASVLIVMLVGTYFIITRQEISAQQKVASERKAILTAIHDDNPKLDQQTVFYMSGNQDYYVEGNKVPFQQGLGYTLLVWYGNNQPIPLDFLADKFLWDLGSQGYETHDGTGFGFFNRLPDLKTALATGEFTADQVRAYYWDTNQQKLTNISDQLQTTLITP